MRGQFSFLFLSIAISWACQTLHASPLAHWQSADQIQIYFQTLKSPSDVQFQLLTADGRSQTLPVLNRRGDFWNLSSADLEPNLKEWIRQAAWIRAQDNQGHELLRTTIRMHGVLDQRFADPKREWGLLWNGNVPTLRIWAPTAQKVELLRFTNSTGPGFDPMPLQEEENGFWSVKGDSSWKGQFYLYRVTLFSPYSERVESHEVTDPLSIALSVEGGRSQMIDPDDTAWKPAGWDNLQKPKLEKLTDSVIYEIHLRDFTSYDEGLSPQERGTFVGLANPQSQALQHLKELAQAGITHVHFLPLMDFGAVTENSRDQLTSPIAGGITPDSPLPQEQIGAIRNRDNYNWGYNPVHWMTPEGSYARNRDGADRVLEMREMVKSLNQAGLRVVLDVVFNHTYSSGIEDFSVFDRIVPGYYYRYNERGDRMNSSCCADVATENVMVEKLILDSLVFLTKTYKVDGFRFDLMNLHPKTQVARIQQALSGMTIAKSGVEGSNLLLYAEAWPFGSLEELSPGSAFTQTRGYGLGMGVFNDRLRDALRGGSTDSGKKSDQGFATGLYWDFNREPANTDTSPDLNAQRDKLLVLNDVVKIGLAGNLRDFTIRDHFNNSVRGGDFYFRGQPVGYAAEPSETISYVSAHDGYSLWDAIQAKLPFHTSDRSPKTATPEDRAKTQQLMLATIMVSQGIPFFEGGSELLRSKSGDVDSYDSGDWFNHIDWSFRGNNWGVGLPPAWKNQNDWSFWRPRLQDPNLRVDESLIQSTLANFKALLKVRRSHPLLRLSSTAEIRRALSFPVDENTGTEIPGFIAMFLEDTTGDLDPEHRSLAVFINASSKTQDFRNHVLAGRAWRKPSELSSAELSNQRVFWNSDGNVLVPARTVLILEEPR